MPVPIENVAILALVYRTLWRERYESPENLTDDFEACPGGISFLGMIGSQYLQETDWGIVRIMDESGSPTRLADDLAPIDPLRTEALLHAWPDDPRDDLPEDGWAAQVLERWPLVEAMMAGLEPLTWNRERQAEVVGERSAL
jgi:hypothetical protein